MDSLFDGFADIRHYERATFEPQYCELLAFENYGKYTLSRFRFERSDVFLFILKARPVVEQAPNGAFAHFVKSEASLVFSVGGLTHITGARAFQTGEATATDCFAGFDAKGVLRLTPGGVLSAVEIGIEHGSEASPFLILNGKRLIIKDETKRSRNRLLLAQLKTGEPAFLYIKSCDVSGAANYAFQLGCACAAIIGNERRIDICGKGIMQNCQSGCTAVYAVR